jgi:hypothetical protein
MSGLDCFRLRLRNDAAHVSVIVSPQGEAIQAVIIAILISCQLLSGKNKYIILSFKKNALLLPRKEFLKKYQNYPNRRC